MHGVDGAWLEPVVQGEERVDVGGAGQAVGVEQSLHPPGAAGVDHPADLVGERADVDAAVGHAVEQVGEVLAAQQLDRVEVAVRGSYLAGEQAAWFGEERERPGVGG